MSPHNPDADSYTDSIDFKQTCERCGQPITHTVINGPGEATNSCGCSVQPELVTDGGVVEQPADDDPAHVSLERFECFECGFEHADRDAFDSDGLAMKCPDCGSLRVEHVFTVDDEDAEIMTDGGVPQSFEDLAGTCESCGDDVDPDLLIEGECPGCQYRPDVATDGGGVTWTDLTGFKRDCLEAVRRLENDGETTYGLAIKRELERQYGEEILHGRLYPNLDGLVNASLVEKGELDKRTNSYELTVEAKSMLDQRARLLADACGMEQPVADGGEVSGTEKQQFRVEVWATSDFTPRVTAATEEEAEEQAREQVSREQFGAEVKSVTVREADAENTWWADVWAQQEYTEDVEATSEEEAKEEAKEILYATTNVVTADIDSIEVREVA